MINNHLMDKQFVFTVAGSYYFFYIKENYDTELYICSENGKVGERVSNIIYTSSTTAPVTPMTKDDFINHLKTF